MAEGGVEAIDAQVGETGHGIRAVIAHPGIGHDPVDVPEQWAACRPGCGWRGHGGATGQQHAGAERRDDRGDAEDEHQHYAERHPVHYGLYRKGSGRADYLDSTWGEQGH